MTVSLPPTPPHPVPPPQPSALWAWLTANVREVVIVALVAVAAFLLIALVEHERQLGRDQVLLAQADSVQAILGDSLKRLAVPIARIDTVVKQKITTVTVQVPQILKESTMVHDTVRIGRDSVLALAIPLPIVDSVKRLLSSCNELAADCAMQRRLLGEQIALLGNDTLAKATQIRILKEQQPSAFRIWAERALWIGGVVAALSLRKP